MGLLARVKSFFGGDRLDVSARFELLREAVSRLTGEAEAVSGNGQFGLCFDDWGNRFVCSNRNPCQHVVIENRYLKKAPTVAIPAVVAFNYFNRQVRAHMCKVEWTAHLALDELKQRWREDDRASARESSAA